MSCSSNTFADSRKSSILIHSGTSQCSLGTSSGCKVRCGSSCSNRAGIYTILALRLGHCLSLLLEFLGERHIVEENIGIVKLVVPCSLQISHCREQLIQFLIADESNERSIGAGRLFAIGGVVVFVGSP